MARKTDKLRPYRVDYFDIPEMKGDRALVRSAVVRAVTAQAARDQVLYGIEAPPVLASGRIIIRSHRYYKNVPTKETFKPVEDLFTVNKAIEVMEVVEKFHDLMKVKNSVVPTVKVIDPGPNAWSGGLKIPIPTSEPVCPYGYTKEDEERGSMTNHNCAIHTNPNPVEFAPKPEVPTTVNSDVLNLPDLPHFDLDTAAPIIYPAPTAIAIEELPATVRGLGFPDYPVVPTKSAVFDDSEYVLTSTGENNAKWGERPANVPFPGPFPLPTWLKVLIFGGVSLLAILIVLAVLNCGH